MMNDQSTSGNGVGQVRRGRVVAGGVLLAVALSALLAPYLPRAMSGVLMPALLGVVFIVWGALARSRGLLVPGGILVGVGVGAWLQLSYGPAAFLLALAGGFLLISVLSFALFGAERCHRWTIWPALGLGIAAAVTGGGPEVRAVFRALHDYWPYALILVALLLIGSGLRDRT